MISDNQNFRSSRHERGPGRHPSAPFKVSPHLLQLHRAEWEVLSAQPQTSTGEWTAMVADTPADASDKAPASLTAEILKRFSEALLQSGEFNAETVQKLIGLASREPQPTATEIETLLREGDSSS